MEIVNLLNDSATKKWNIIDSEPKGNYSPENTIKFSTSSLETSFCDYSDAYVLVTGNIAITGGDANTKVAFKNCASLKECGTNKWKFWWWNRTY